MLTVEQFKEALPSQVKKTINQELIDKINKSLRDPEALAIYQENLLSFTSVLQNGKFKMESYLNAVRYVGFKVMGSTNLDAYIKTFPAKYQDFLSRGVAEKDIASYVSAFNKSKLVNLIFEQSLIPTHILNAPLFQKALNTQADLMMNARSEKVRADAANSLLTHLKAPGNVKVELDIGVNTAGSVIEDYELAMRKMVEQQQKLIAAGGDLKQIANASVRAGDASEEDDPPASPISDPGSDPVEAAIDVTPIKLFF